VIIKADVRGSTKMTQDFAGARPSPASHFSLNLHEPVKKLLEKYGAKKVFIEGDAIILAIFETESSRTYARSVAKACVLARQILTVCNSYNDSAASSDLPALELGLGVAHQGDAPTYWTDGESRVMISKALNLSDRLSGCAKLARRMLGKTKITFRVVPVFANDGRCFPRKNSTNFLCATTANGIELNEEGFPETVRRNFSRMHRDETRSSLGQGNRHIVLRRSSPWANRSNCSFLRKGPRARTFLRRKIGPPSTHVYYEVCTAPALYGLVAALLRTRHAALEKPPAPTL